MIRHRIGPRCLYGLDSSTGSISCFGLNILDPKYYGSGSDYGDYGYDDGGGSDEERRRRRSIRGKEKGDEGDEGDVGDLGEGRRMSAILVIRVGWMWV
jgi:hypothetical protein